MSSIYFYLISGIAATAGIGFSFITRGIFYNSPDTDNELMAHAAAQSHKWKWLSDVHKYSASSRKVSMKECTIIILSIFQKIFRDKTTDRPYVAMTGLAISMSTILIYLIASNYFNQATGLVIAIIYIVSFWPWQISLYGGHVNMANLFFLLSVYSIQMSLGDSLSPFILIAVGGAFFCCCLFSSSSSYKYLVPVFASLFFSEYSYLIVSRDFGALKASLPINYLISLDTVIIAVFLFAYLFVRATYKILIKKMYNKEAPDFLNKMIQGRDSFALEHYINSANKKILRLGCWLFWLLFSLLTIINSVFISTIIAFVAGFALIFLVISLPNIKENTVKYFSYMLAHKKKTHFKGYVNYFAKRGIAVQGNMRGVGLSWVPKMLWTFAPFHIILFVTAFAVGLYRSIGSGNITESITLIIVTIIALSPIIWSEITTAPQISRTYSPGLITSLLLPAYVISGTIWTAYTLLLFSGFGILTFAWNLWRFSDDVYPARMTVQNFMRIIRQLGINDIYTYQTSSNFNLMGSIPGIGKSEYLPKQWDIVPPFRIHYIQRLDEVVDGWIAIPGANILAITPTGENISDDYTKDPLLNRLIETKQMEKIAVAKLKTCFTSTIWINEDEVTSYCALHLKDFGPDDLYRGHAWLVHSSKLKI